MVVFFRAINVAGRVCSHGGRLTRRTVPGVLSFGPMAMVPPVPSRSRRPGGDPRNRARVGSCGAWSPSATAGTPTVLIEDSGKGRTGAWADFCRLVAVVVAPVSQSATHGWRPTGPGRRRPWRPTAQRLQRPAPMSTLRGASLEVGSDDDGISPSHDRLVSTTAARWTSSLENGRSRQKRHHAPHRPHLAAPCVQSHPAGDTVAGGQHRGRDFAAREVLISPAAAPLVGPEGKIWVHDHRSATRRSFHHS